MLISIDEKVLDFPRAEVTPAESTRRVMVEATRLASLAPGEWRLWIDRSAEREYRGRGPITKNQVAALLRDYDIRPVVVHPTKRADFSRHGYRAAQFEDAFARFLPHEPNIRTLKSGREKM